MTEQNDFNWSTLIGRKNVKFFERCSGLNFKLAFRICLDEIGYGEFIDFHIK